MNQEIDMCPNVPPKVPKKITVSHMMLFAVLATYFIGLALGCYIVVRILNTNPDYAVQAFLGLLSYIGIPVGTAIAFYSWKAKNENVAKIEARGNEDE